MRLITYVNKSLYNSLISNDQTVINDSNLMLWDRYHKDFNGIPCLACACEHRSISFMTVAEFYPSVQINHEWNVDSDWILVELEVPEDDIIHLRVRYESTVTCTDGSDFRLPNKDLRIVDDKLQWMRGYYNEPRYNNSEEETVWAVLKYIRHEWVVSIREFICVEEMYSSAKYCRILYMDLRKFPLWRETSRLSPLVSKLLLWMHDSTAPVIDGNQEKYDEFIAYQDAIGMHGCPGYFTVEEAMYCCDIKTKEMINYTIKSKRFGKRPKGQLLIQDLFGGDLVYVDKISDEKIRLLSSVFTKDSTRESIRLVYTDDNIATIYKYITGREQTYADTNTMIDILLDTANVYAF